MDYAALSKRTMSSYPLSIGTAISFESLGMGPNPAYDAARPIPNHVELAKYDQFWVNLLTLFRNMMGAIAPQGSGYSIDAADLAEALLQEAETIVEIAKQYSPSTKVIFYSSNYESMKSKYPHARIRGDITENQKLYTAHASKTLSAFYKRRPKTLDVRHFTRLIEPTQRGPALILTNYAYDLLAWKKFETLDLLESHTGVLKTRALWYTKFLSADATARIPLNKMFLQVFGDSTLFFAFDSRSRKDVVELAEKHKWTYATSETTIRMSLGELKNPLLVSILKSM
jgi:hypothetical protein